MKLFLDSAITEEIAHALDTWDMDGLTTNPRHVMVSGKPFRVVIAEIAEMVKGTDKPVSVEVNPHYTDCDEIVKQGRELAALSPNFVIKVGACEGGFKAIRELSKDGIRTNATLIMSVAQACRPGRGRLSNFLVERPVRRRLGYIDRRRKGNAGRSRLSIVNHRGSDSQCQSNRRRRHRWGPLHNCWSSCL